MNFKLLLFLTKCSITTTFLKKSLKCFQFKGPSLHVKIWVTIKYCYELTGLHNYFSWIFQTLIKVFSYPHVILAREKWLNKDIMSSNLEITPNFVLVAWAFSLDVPTLIQQLLKNWISSFRFQITAFAIFNLSNIGVNINYIKKETQVIFILG